MGDQEPVQREDEDDHDLLTYGEVRFRLHEAVVAQQVLVDRLEREGSPTVEAARGRLAGLREAVERNARQPINDDNFEKFFGYPGVAKRNT